MTVLMTSGFLSNQAYAGPPACLASSTLGALLANPTNCIVVDDKTFINFRIFNSDFDPALIDVTGVTVGNEKGLQFNSRSLVNFAGGLTPKKSIVFDYDVISSGDPISDNTLTLNTFSVFDDEQSPNTGVLIEERVVAEQKQIAFKDVFADGLAQDLLDHVDYPSPHQMVTVNVNIEVTSDQRPDCQIDVLATCDASLSQFTQTFSQQPQPESQVIGGEIIPIESTSLILAGAQSFSWMIPVVLSVIGIGLFVVSRKSENS